MSGGPPEEWERWQQWEAGSSHSEGWDRHGTAPQRRGGRGRGRGGSRTTGGSRGRGRGGGHPAGLKGKEIGLYYARQGSKRRRERERAERPVVSMDRDQQQRISSIVAGAEQLPEPPQADRIAAASAAPAEVNHKQLAGDQLDAVNTALVRDAAVRQAAPDFQAMLEFRRKLPAYQMRKEIVAAVAKSQVLVISGETGCGKTTQVPQFLLDDAIERGQGASCRIVCTQPRRISAISVAERVAAERCEPCGGASCGYQIRLESRAPREHGSILYCTTGILLRKLVGDPTLAELSHIVIDEIHERDLLSDFLLIVLRDLVATRPDLKLILMSATLNAAQFSVYFGNCPTLEIPGFTFPVKEYWLEDIIPQIGYKPHHGPAHQHRGSARGRGSRFAGRGRHRARGGQHRLAQRVDDNNPDGNEEEQGTIIDPLQTYLEAEQQAGRIERGTAEALSCIDFDNIDYDLVLAVMRHICLNCEEGAILCFVPGWEDISKIHDRLSNEAPFRDASKYRVIPLHSLMPTVNQRTVFERPPSGVRKIVIATVIAETSITIDDVVFVLDCGKTKEKHYDSENQIASLRPVWVSKASARQRRGRAGRVQDGHCFHLYSRHHHETMADFQVPEMLRTPLEEMVLQLKSLHLGGAQPFLAKALEPPSSGAVAAALSVLTSLAALDAAEELTPLGMHLAHLPVDPRVGKLILFGAIFSCVEPILIIASSLGFRDPFVVPLNKQRQADDAKMRLANGCKSDHLTVLAAFHGWKQAQQSHQGWTYCREFFLSQNTLQMIDQMRKQFFGLLCDIGFVDQTEAGRAAANRHSGNLNLVKAVLCAGLYPHVASVRLSMARVPRPPKLFLADSSRAYLHPKSVLSDEVHFPVKWLIYHKKVRTTQIFLHDASMVTPYALLFFGGEIDTEVDEGHELVVIDKWIRFRASRSIAELVMQLRERLDAVLRAKVNHPTATLAALGGDAVVEAIIELVTTEDLQEERQLQGRKCYDRQSRRSSHCSAEEATAASHEFYEQRFSSS
eukprot:m.163632 g.163632  ORF g.163632 m.163632 type:complete len:1019 (-) comp10307_c0_seq24:1459-4515(-)